MGGSDSVQRSLPLPLSPLGRKISKQSSAVWNLVSVWFSLFFFFFPLPSLLVLLLLRLLHLDIKPELQSHLSLDLFFGSLPDLRLIYLVRDPRGILNSRLGVEFCRHNPDCDDPEVLCKDLVQDFNAWRRLRTIFAQRVRYFY